MVSEELDSSSEDSDSSSVSSEKPDDETLKKYCLGAMRGEFIPPKLHYGRVEACMVHGLRHHEAFAESEPVKELCTTTTEKVFTRARNARLIMSNKIPPMTDDEEKPYCIWYPDVATVDAYRELAQRYPDMRYHVGRACAVGGYFDLYRELDLLPDISIAEEAFHNTDLIGVKEIYNHIMCQPVRYSVLDDYTRSVNLESPRIATGLNGDTAVLSSLRRRLDFWRHWYKARHYFNITEDHGVGEDDYGDYDSEDYLELEHVPLLYNPLPLDLPTTKKDVLIIHAAYEGNIDRYARLRRPIMIIKEEYALIRGIHHSTAFARWCLGQPKDRFGYNYGDIRLAINARFIMVNDLSRITPPYQYIPFMIWWPLLPQEDALRELVRRIPNTRRQVAMTCIAADYKRLWDELTPDPDPLLLQQATQCANQNYYVEDLERRAANLGIDLRASPKEIDWVDYECARRDKEPTTTLLAPAIRTGWEGEVASFHENGSIYPGQIQANAAEWEVYIAVTDEVRESLWNNGYSRSSDNDVVYQQD
ncbi:Alpha-mannosyltransferase protein [Rutstroemia sp. NJR-2017a BVV2]|nr:Alpha-mannosyltransferase protein [Rutstroemia sp. NJR-2017a BVV2]